MAVAQASSCDKLCDDGVSMPQQHMMATAQQPQRVLYSTQNTAGDNTIGTRRRTCTVCNSLATSAPCPVLPATSDGGTGAGAAGGTLMYSESKSSPGDTSHGASWGGVAGAAPAAQAATRLLLIHSAALAKTSQ